MQVENAKELPRLLEREDSPPLARSRWYWRYVHRWRKRLFDVWRRDVPGGLDDAAIARSVDDLVAVALQLEYLRRSGCTDLATIQDVCQSVSQPTVPRVTGAIAEYFSSPFLTATFEPGGFADSPPIPQILFHDSWETRIGNATWLVYQDTLLAVLKWSSA